jgi:S-formylglutathione hydrolase FrmB
MLFGFAAVGSASAQVPTAPAQMPTASDCAAGQGEGVTLGEHIGSAAVCVSAGGHTVAYVAGNALQPCGTIIVADQTATSEDPNACDRVLDLPPQDRLDFGVVLPSDYAVTVKRYPVLYLLSSGPTSEWPHVDPQLQAVANMGVIIILPNQGMGFYNDWFNGAHRFETLDTTTLIDYVDAHYRTIPDRAHRAVAGASKAGYGAMLFAARHPDLYAAAASFSGIVDLAPAAFRYAFAAELSTGYATYTHPANPTDNPIWGNATSEAVWWHDKDPTDLAGNLRGIELYNAAGTGAVAPDEVQASGPTAALACYEESTIRLQNMDFNRALKRAGVPNTWVPHQGCHDGYYWVKELHQWAPTMMSVFNHPTPAPVPFDYRSADSTFSVWGWTFRADPRRAPEFLDVTNASAAALTLRGSGTTTVQTAGLYLPGQQLCVGEGTSRPRVMTADAQGRVTFTVNLGNPHPLQQYSARQLAAGRQPGYFTTRTATIHAC